MRVLVVRTHPRAESFCSAITTAVQAGLDAAGHEHRLLDLYAEGFDPVLSVQEWEGHLSPPESKPQIEEHIRAIRWAEAIVFVHPTWWSGPPAMLRGWLQRVLVHGFAFSLRPNGGPIRGELKWIRRLAVVTTHGSPRWVNNIEGHVGRRQLLRGLRSICATTCRTWWVAMYKLDHSTQKQREDYLVKVEKTFADWEHRIVG